jgi:hypothetical protein
MCDRLIPLIECQVHREAAGESVTGAAAVSQQCKNPFPGVQWQDDPRQPAGAAVGDQVHQMIDIHQHARDEDGHAVAPAASPPDDQGGKAKRNSSVIARARHYYAATTCRITSAARSSAGKTTSAEADGIRSTQRVTPAEAYSSMTRGSLGAP